MKARTFQEQFDELGIQHAHLSFLDSCAPCAFLYGRHRKADLPSKFEILREVEKNGTALYSVTAPMENDDALALIGRCKISYILSGDAGSGPWAKGETALESREWRDGDEDEQYRLELATLVRKNTEWLPADDSENARRRLKDYLEIASFRRLYHKYGRLVASLLAHEVNRHPVLEVPTLHVGFVGYDSEEIDADAARWLKSEWIRQLGAWNRDGRSISATIDWFNHRSLSLAQKVGLSPRFIRLERR